MHVSSRKFSCYNHMGYFIDFFTFRGNNAKTPEFFEDLFCNLGCYEEYRLRTSNQSIRQVRKWIKFEPIVVSNTFLFCSCVIFSRKKHGRSLNISHFFSSHCSQSYLFQITYIKFSGSFWNRTWCLYTLPVRLSQACEAHKTFIIGKTTRVHWESSTKCG